MVSIISLLLIVTLSILITRIATIALAHTGLSREAARFQARSAFTGVGFTTSESEKVVNHPVRRRILLILMLLGNAGIVTAITSLLLGFIKSEGAASFTPRILLLITGLVVLYALARSRWIDKNLSKFISWALKRYTQLEIRDYANLLRLTGDYRVNEFHVEPEDWLANRTLGDLKLRREGIVVLGISRDDGTYIGAPDGSTKVRSNDTMILYGRVSAIEKLDRRKKGKSGDREHDEACEEQEEIERRGKQEDPAERE
jgi:hypothetical protein